MPLPTEIDSHLKRWVDARIIDYSTADRIRQYESTQAPGRQSNWMVILAIAFGAVMLGAGVLLFVAAHWDQLSPTQRFLLVLTMVAGFHIAAGLLIERLRALGSALHAIGTISLGGGIFLAGQIFNMQEHWPGGIMLWAIGAVVAWFILQDTAQAVVAAILVPAWIGSELSVRFQYYIGSETAIAEFTFMVALVYLGMRGSDRNFARAMHILGGILLLPAAVGVIATAHENYFWQHLHEPTVSMRLFVTLVAFGIPLIAAWLTRGRRAGVELGFAVWLMIAVAIAPRSYNDVFAEMAIYGWCALGAIAMVIWGVRAPSNSFINMGVLAFALDIMVFYFSSVMDKLGRSASLIGFGMLFLLGGWYLEKLRRKLILHTAGGAQ